jgi:hypothetical protein
VFVAAFLHANPRVSIHRCKAPSRGEDRARPGLRQGQMGEFVELNLSGLRFQKAVNPAGQVIGPPDLFVDRRVAEFAAVIQRGLTACTL